MSTLIWLSFVCFLASNLPAGSDNPLQIQERAPIQTPIAANQELKGFLRKEGLKKGVPDFVGKAGIGVANLVRLNFSKPTSELIWDIADVVVPIVSVGLALIPGVGPFIAGAVSFIYGMLSTFLRGTPENPMAKVVNDIRTELEKIHSRFPELEKKITDEVRAERNHQFKSIMNRAFHSEISRNEYICNKYARVSHLFSQELKSNHTIDESLRLEMMTLIQNCDNFLKDTTESFVYPEFADAFWVPSVIMTFLRVPFLTEVANYGVSLKIDEPTISMFWEELKADIKRHLELIVEAVKLRTKIIRSGDHLTQYEYAGCKLQKNLVYFDRQIYPFGVPKQMFISDDDSEVNMGDFNITTEDDEIQHIQILYNEYQKQLSDNSLTMVNCLMGPAMITRMPLEVMTFRITYVPQKSYQIRVLYFMIEEFALRKDTEKNTKNEYVPLTTNQNDYIMHHRRNPKNVSISAHKENKGDPFQVMRITDAESNESPQRFDFKTAIFSMYCTSKRESERFLDMFNYNYEDIKNEKCFLDEVGYIGRFVIETVLAFNVLSDNDSKSTMILEDIRFHGMNSLFWGVELIVRPVQQFLATW